MDTDQGLERDEYDVVVIGTGLAESIIASSCAKRGLSVLHLDRNDYYGDRHASLTVTELVQQLGDRNCKLPNSDFERDVDRLSRQYALSLYPAVLPSRGPLIDLLISQDVGKYVNFRLVDSVLVWQEEKEAFRRVPGSKEQIFKDSSLSLLQKRRLMKFLMEAASDDSPTEVSSPFIEFLQSKYQLPGDLARTIAYAIAFSPDEHETAKPALERVKKYLKSAGRYGPSSFLVAQFGGVGEITQAFCRASAVHGGTYVLGKQGEASNWSSEGSTATLSIPAHPRSLKARKVVSISNPSLPREQAGKPTANYVAILPEVPGRLRALLKRPLSEEDGENDIDDVALLIFPPSGGRKTVTRCLLMGEGTGSCPAGQTVLYIQSLEASTSRESIQPHLDLILDGVVPLFEAMYSTFKVASTPPQADWSVQVKSETALPLQWLEGLDGEATAAIKVVEQICPASQASDA